MRYKLSTDILGEVGDIDFPCQDKALQGFIAAIRLTGVRLPWATVFFDRRNPGLEFYPVSVEYRDSNGNVVATIKVEIVE